MAKAVFAGFLGSMLLLLPMVAPGDQQHLAQTSVYRSFEAGKPQRSAGRLQGRIVSIDYASGELLVQTARGRLTVAVVPSTTFYHGRQYETLSDLRAGQHVDIEASEVDGSLVAQTIRF